MAEISQVNKNIIKAAEKFKDKLAKIKVCIFDIDGILTDGTITYDEALDGYNRTFNIVDGYGLKILMNNGIKVGVVSGGDSKAVRKRFTENLKVDFWFLGNLDKRGAYLEILQMGYTDEEILFMGDEFIDLPVLERVGFSVSVPMASYEIQEAVDYITHYHGGHGAVREICDIVRIAKNLNAKVEGF